MNKTFSLFSYCDAARLWQFGIQDPATPAAEGMLFFHNYIMFYVVAIGLFVYWMLYAALETNSKVPSKFSHSSTLEIVWTILPAIILVFIAIPSFSLLYALDDSSDTSNCAIKVIGHQWYWSYEFCYTEIKKGGKLKFGEDRFDSYMLSTISTMGPGTFRLLEVDYRLILPLNSHIRLLVTSSDVIHSWAVPSLGVKIDAIPGRLSQVGLYIKREGVFYGQCSEICGVNHGFMPIVVRSTYYSCFRNWLNFKGPKSAFLPRDYVYKPTK
jgi:cytochrome c oxidase subunit 2